MQIEGTKLIFVMNFSVLDFFKFASRMPQFAQVNLNLQKFPSGGGGGVVGEGGKGGMPSAPPPPPPPEKFPLFLSLLIPGSVVAF